MLGKVLLITGGKVNMDFAEEYTASQEYDTVVCADSGFKHGIPAWYAGSLFYGRF